MQTAILWRVCAFLALYIAAQECETDEKAAIVAALLIVLIYNCLPFNFSKNGIKDTSQY